MIWQPTAWKALNINVAHDVLIKDSLWPLLHVWSQLGPWVLISTSSEATFAGKIGQSTVVSSVKEYKGMGAKLWPISHLLYTIQILDFLLCVIYYMYT